MTTPWDGIRLPSGRLCLAVLLLAAAALLGVACDDGDAEGETREGPTIVVGAFDFAESHLLAQIYAQAMEADRYPVDSSKILPGSPRQVIAPALESGEIDLVAEYVGSLRGYFVREGRAEGEPTSDGEENRQAAADVYAEDDVTLLEIGSAQNTNQLVASASVAEQYGLQTVSDLQGVASELTLGGPPECPENTFCIPGFERVYDIEFGEFIPLDFGARVTSLREGAIDLALLFSTDAVIQQEGFVPLEDDMGLQPAENIAPAVRTEVLDAHEGLAELLNRVTAELTTEDLRDMNFAVQVDQRDPDDVAREWLVEHGFIEE